MKKVVTLDEFKNIEDAAIEQLGIDLTVSNESVSTFLRRSDRFLFNDPMQRGFVWTLQQKCDLIHSILAGIPIPPVIAQMVSRSKKLYFNMLDGKQKMLSTRDFVKGKFALSPKTALLPITTESGDEVMLDLSNAKFDDLTEEMQATILEFTFTVYQLRIEHVDKETVEEIKNLIFRRHNNGTALTKGEKRKTLMRTHEIEKINEIKKMPLFKKAVTEDQFLKDIPFELVLHSLVVLEYEGNTALDGKTIDQFVSSGKLTDSLFDRGKTLASYIDEVISSGGFDETQIKKLLKRSKLTAIFLAAEEAIQREWEKEKYAHFLQAFFLDSFNDNRFKEYTLRGSAQQKNVRKRMEIMIEQMDNFI